MPLRFCHNLRCSPRLGSQQPALAVGAGVLRLQGASHCPCVPTAQHNKQALLQDWHARVVLKRQQEETVRDADETVA